LRLVVEKKECTTDNMAHHFSISSEAVENVDLTSLAQYVPNETYKQYFLEEAGREHYKLISHLASQVPMGSTIADLGTLYGLSALALAAGKPSATIETYDIKDWIPSATRKVTSSKFPNIHYKFQDGVSEDVAFHVAASQMPLVILDVDPHDGKQERACVEHLTRAGFEGLLLCDDIHLNTSMEAFWAWVPHKKLDVTHLGHWSGSGLITFAPSSYDILEDID
jgi:predicted O-methyltransferase YrrM